MSRVPAWIQSWLKADTIWHQEVSGWMCIISRGTGKFPYVFDVISATEGIGGPSLSFDEAMKRIEEFLKRKNLHLSKKQNVIPGFEP